MGRVRARGKGRSGGRGGQARERSEGEIITGNEGQNTVNGRLV